MKPKIFLLFCFFLAGPLVAQPVITNQPVNQTVVLGGNVTFNVAVSGVGPFTYQWQFNKTNLPNDIITTVAGNGSPIYTYSGDGGAATNAGLYYPQGVAFDAAGDLYIADNDDERIRKVDANGIITTVAGNGVVSEIGVVGSFSGDGGAATNAGLSQPNNVAFDAAGNMYIADFNNDRVRKVDTNGIITTVAGNGNPFEPPFDGYPATDSSLASPACVAFDAAGNMYIAQLGYSVIRKVDTNTNGIITTVAGNFSYGYSGDGGAATNASLHFPQGVAFDAEGNLYIADTENYRVRKVDTNGIITTVAGNGTEGNSGDGDAATNANLSRPWSVDFDASGAFYIADKGNNNIRKVDTNGIITTVAGNGVAAYGGDGGAATNASLNGPACVALDAMGNLYIADWYNNRIREVHFAGLPTLTLPQVDATNAGNYTVTITSPYGSVTSSNVTLSVLIPPKITTFSSRNGAFNFTWSAQSNLTYQVQYTTNLVAPDWIDLGSPITATSNSISTTDIPGSAAQRFYRVFLMP